MRRIFTKHFDDYACEMDSITGTRDGFDFVATIYRDHDCDSPEDRDNGFWPSLDPNSAGYIGAKTKSTLARHTVKARGVLRAWENNDWFYCGVAVTVSRNGVELTDEFSNALWGIECNYPSRRKNNYLRDVANELAETALIEARAKLAELREVA